MIEQLLQSLGSIAWACFAIVALVLFRKQIASLLMRIRKGAGAEFDALPQPQKPSANDMLPKTKEPTTDLPFTITPTIRALEDVVRELPILASVTDPDAREKLLITLLARAFLIDEFERIDRAIFASQLDLLTKLNVTSGGLSREYVRRSFYEPVASRQAEQFKDYPFEFYLNFLVNFGLLEVSQGRVGLTNKGREYLVWRVANRKVPTRIG